MLPASTTLRLAVIVELVRIVDRVGVLHAATLRCPVGLDGYETIGFFAPSHVLQPALASELGGDLIATGAQEFSRYLDLLIC